MAVRIPLNQLTHDESLVIRQHLFMQPKDSYNPNQSLFADNPGKEPIEFYQVTNDYIDLPMAFAASLKGVVPNRHLPHLAISIKFSPDKKLYARQIEVVKEALHYLITYGGVHLNLNTGFGKTIVSAYLAAELGSLTLIYMTRKVIIKQWAKVFTFFVVGAKIWIVGDPEKELTILVNNLNNVGGQIWLGSTPPTLPAGEYLSVIICMDGRYTKIPKELMDLVGTVIVDESHNFCTKNTVAPLLAPHPRYFISCSASLDQRTDGMETMIKSIVGNTEINRYSDKPFKFIQVNTNIKVPIVLNKQGKTDFNRLINDLCALESRNRLILHLVSTNPDKKLLVMTGRVEHAKYLYEVLKTYGESVDYMAGKKETYKDSRVLVGSYSKIGEAFDEENFCDDYGGRRLDTLILCTSFKSEKNLTQIAGRVFRAEFPVIYDLVDDIDLIKKRHWPARKKWYLSKNGEHMFMNVNLDVGSMTKGAY